MGIRVSHPNGSTIEFPDGTDEGTITRVMTEFGGGSGGVGLFAAPAIKDAAPASRSWASIPGEAAKNLGQSAKNFAYNVTAPIHSPIQTAKGLTQIAAGVGSKIVGAADTVSEAVGGPDLQSPDQKEKAERALNAVGGFLKDRYGGVENIKRTLAQDPVGAVGDVATVLYTGGATLPGRVGQLAKTAGATIDPIRAAGKVASVAGKKVGKVASVGAGSLTGAQSLPFEKAFDAGRYGSKTFAPNMRGYGSLDDVAARAEGAVGQLVKDRSRHYNAWTPLTTMRGIMKPLSTKALDQSIADAAKMGSRSGVVTNRRTYEVVSEIENVVNTYKKNGWTTAKDLDELKQIVYDIGGAEKQGSRSHKAAMNIYHTIGNQLKSQVPGYEGVMKDYAQASDLIKQMRNELSLNNRAGAGTKLRKLQSAMRNNATTANGKRTQLVDELSRIDKEIPYALAGQSLNSLAPRGIQGAGVVGVGALATQAPMTAAMLPFMSPRLMGEASYGAGKVARQVDNANRAGLSPELLARLLLTSRLAGAATDQPLE